MAIHARFVVTTSAIKEAQSRQGTINCQAHLSAQQPDDSEKGTSPVTALLRAARSRLRRRATRMRAPPIWALVASVLTLMWSIAIEAQSECVSVYRAVINDPINYVIWTGSVPTFDEAVTADIPAMTTCFSDGLGGCLSGFTVSGCYPTGGYPVWSSVTTASCGIVTSEDPDFWLSVVAYAAETDCGYFVQANWPLRDTSSTNAPGDPINPGAGNVFKTETDVLFPETSGAVSFQRFYNSVDAVGADAVPGWHHSYDQMISAIYSPPIAPYPGASATVSEVYSDPGTACVSGFEAIQSNVNGWSSATATYTDGVCIISTSAGVISTLPVWAVDPPATTPPTTPIEYDVIRPDGRTLRYTLQGGVINNPPGVSEQLALTGSGFTFTDDQDNVETYNASGVLQSITNRAGVVQTLSYTSGVLSSVADSLGNSLSFTRNSGGSIATVTANGGGEVQYTYDGSSRLSSVTNLDSTTRSYLYGDSSFIYAMTGEDDESGTQLLTWGYDSQGRGTSSQLASGAFATSVTYNSDGTVTSTDALGATRTFTYTRIGDVSVPVSISGSQCPTCQESAATTYDAAGWVASRTDYNDNLTCYANDATRGLELVRVEGFASGSSCPSDLSSYTPTSGTSQRKISTTWSSSYRLPTLITEANRTTGFSYDSSGNLLTKTITDTTVMPNIARTWTYTYDSLGHVLTVDGPRTDVTDVTTYTYYSCTSGYQCGHVHTVTDAIGNVTTYNTYNAYGQPLTITDPNSVVTTLTYDARERLTSREVGTETTSFSYYSTGLLEQVTLPDSSYVQYSYDSAHRLTGISDGAGNSIAYTLDAMGNRTAEKSYDPSSTLHRSHTRVYNTLSELYQDINAANTSSVTTTYTYDSNGNRTAANAPLSRDTSYAFDALNRVNQITDPNSGVAQFTYDANNNLTSVTDPRSLTTSYTYSGFGELTQQTSPDTGSTTNTYYPGGNLHVSTDARSSSAHYTYDADNRVASIVYKSGSGVTDQTLSFGYDSGTYGKGRLTSAGDGNETLSWVYDGQGRVTGKGQTVGTVTLSVGYGYASGDLTGLETPSGQAIVYTYNSDHQITGITVNGTTLLSSVTYEPFGAANGWSWGSGDTVSRSYNGDGLISQIVSASVTSGYSFDYANRVSALSDSSSSTLSWSYGYDVLDRITSATTSSITDGWTYDANGNRASQTGTNATTFTVNTGNNQLNSTTGALTRSYVYDAAGHTEGYASYVFTYNNRGRMNATSSGSTSYLYNALGQMVEKAGTGGTNLFVYDESGHILGEYDGSGNLIEETIWLGDIPVATLRPSGSSVAINYVHTDHLNTPTKVTRSSDNALLWRIDQDPYGTASPNQNPGGIGTFVYNLRSPGQLYMSETGLNYNYFRDYDPQIGKYVESDPIGFAAGVDTYTYADGNPANYADSTGQCPWCVPVAVGALVGALANVGGSLASGNPVTFEGVLTGAGEGAATVILAGEIVATTIVGGTVRAIGAVIGDLGITAAVGAIETAVATSSGGNPPTGTGPKSCPP